jgi:hypothetical protein
MYVPAKVDRKDLSREKYVQFKDLDLDKNLFDNNLVPD